MREASCKNVHSKRTDVLYRKKNWGTQGREGGKNAKK